MSDIIITGGLGYIGSSLLHQIDIESFDNVIIIDLDLFNTFEQILKKINKNKISKLIFKKNNFANIEVIDQIFNKYKVDTVIHLGGLVGDPACAIDLTLTNKINKIATENLIAVSAKNKVRKFIFASTCSVYGVNEKICNERTEPNPISEYARSKLKGEMALSSFQDKFEEVIILRFSTLYGVSERIRFDLVTNLFYAKARWENTITLFGGWQWRPFLNVKDAAYSLCCALKQNGVGLKIYNVGLETGNSTLLELANLTIRNFKNCKIVDIGSGDDARNYKVNFNKFNDKFNSPLKFDLETGVDALFNDLKNFNANWLETKYSNYLTTKKNVDLLLEKND